MKTKRNLIQICLLGIILLLPAAGLAQDFSNAKWTTVSMDYTNVTSYTYNGTLYYFTNKVSGYVEAMAGDAQGNLYVGGTYLYGLTGNTNAWYVAKWDGHNWSSLGSGVNWGVGALTVSDTNIYAGGAFTMAGGTQANAIAKWDGSNWTPLGSGINEAVRAITLSGTNLYAGGVFTSPGQDIAKWDGNNWSALGSGFPWISAYQTVSANALAVIGNTVYAGGTFEVAGGNSITKIAKWDGTNWSALGPGINDSQITSISALAVMGTDLYVGGYFSVTTTNGSAAYIARWDGSNWSSLGAGLTSDNGVESIVVSGNNLYVGGGFTAAGSVATTNSMAMWDGKNWTAIGAGSGITYVYAMAIVNGIMYVAGQDDAGNDLFAMTASANSSSSSITIGGFSLTNGGFNFNITGPSGTNVVIEASTNLQSWLPLSTNTLVSGTNYFSDATWTNYPSRYYRVRTQ